MRRERLYAILEELERMGDMAFRCLARTTDLDLDVLEKMKRAGCVQIDIGQESGSQRILDLNNKKTKVEDGYRACSLCKQIGIVAKICLVLGLPGENRESIEETKKFIRDSGAEGFCLNSFIPLPGCSVFNDPAKYNYKFDQSISFDQYQQVAKDERGTGKILASNKEEIRGWGQELLKEMGDKALWLEYERRVGIEDYGI